MKRKAPRRDEVDFLLIAGNLFERDRVTPGTVEFLKRHLPAAPLCGGSAPGGERALFDVDPELEDAAAAVSFLLSDAARYVTGANIPVGGGWGV